MLSYEGVSVSESWGYERFMYRGKSVAKMRANVKSINIFFNLNAAEYVDTKYKLQDVSSTKVHASTPSKFVLDGPRKLAWAKQLVDGYMEQAGGKLNVEYKYQKFEFAHLDIEQLIQMGLIKAEGINQEYERIIYSEE